MQVPIIAIAGSGNHGIANFLGILAVAETLGSPEERLLKALAISSTVTVTIKGTLRGYRPSAAVPYPPRLA